MATISPLNISNFCNKTSNTIEGVRIPSIIILSFLIVIGIIPNILMIQVVYFNRLLQKPIYYFMANLAVGNTIQIMAIIANLALANSDVHQIPSHILGVLCKILAIFPYYWSYMACIKTLIIISFERYQVVFRPFKKLSTKKVKFLCALAWIVSLIIAFPYLLTATSDKSKRRSCIPFDHITIWITIITVISFIFQFAIPTITMTVLYWLIFHRLTRKTIITPQESARSKILKRQSIFMLMTTVVFVIFSLPWAISLLVVIITGKIPFDIVSDNINPNLPSIVSLSKFILPLTTLYNPIIYCIIHPNLRHALFSRFCHLPKFRRASSLQVIHISST